MASVQEIAAEMLRVFDSKPERWTQGSLARDAEGAPVCLSRNPPVAFCVSGAFAEVCKGTPTTRPERVAFIAALERCTGNNVPAWNDDRDRTFEDVQKLLTELAEAP